MKWCWCLSFLQVEDVFGFDFIYLRSRQQNFYDCFIPTRIYSSKTKKHSEKKKIESSLGPRYVNFDHFILQMGFLFFSTWPYLLLFLNFVDCYTKNQVKSENFSNELIKNMLIKPRMIIINKVFSYLDRTRKLHSWLYHRGCCEQNLKKLVIRTKCLQNNKDLFFKKKKSYGLNVYQLRTILSYYVIFSGLIWSSRL